MSDIASIERLLSSNDVPTTLEAASIRNEIDLVTDKISKLTLELEQLQELRRTRRATLSPIRRMPIEVLSKIFVFVFPPLLNKQGREDLVGLSLVSKGWHRAVCLTHQLWSGLEAQRDTPYEKVAG